MFSQFYKHNPNSMHKIILQFSRIHMVLVKIFSICFNKSEIHDLTVCLYVSESSQTEEVCPVVLQRSRRYTFSVCFRWIYKIGSSRQIVIHCSVIWRHVILQMLQKIYRRNYIKSALSINRGRYRPARVKLSSFSIKRLPQDTHFYVIPVCCDRDHRSMQWLYTCTAWA